MNLRQQERSAPAKINLYLEIIGKRPDGFHQLETIFQTIDLADHLSISEIETDNETQIQYKNAKHDFGDNDICFRAVESLRASVSQMPSIRVEIEKHIPIGGGLGGASSDAAAILKTLASWYQIDQAEIQRVALELGSDVPFFLNGGTMYATGRGEQLSVLNTPHIDSCYLITLQAGQETAAVFRELDAEERGPRPAQGLAYWQRRDASSVLFNRLSAPACRINAELREVFAEAEALRIPIYMSGSGSSCFSFDPRAQELSQVQVRRVQFLAAES